MKHHSISVGVLVGLAILMYLFTPFGRDLWLPDEPRYAEVAMEMANTDNWIIPHLNGELYSEKPPLFFWQLALSSGLFGGWHSFAMIAPAGFAAIGCILMTYALATMLFNRHVATLSALVLMTMLLFTGVGQMVRMDMFLILCFMFSFLAFYKIYTHRQTNTWGYAFLFYMAAGLSTLTKGPIGLGLPGLIITIFVLWKYFVQRESPFDFELFGKLHVIPGSVLYVAIVLAWFLPAVRQQGWDYAYLITIRQNLGRVVDSFSHARPWYFYLYTLPWITLPWFPFLVSAAVKQRSIKISQYERDALTFLWVWWATTFLFFTCVSGKLEIYLLPLFPPTAILVGRLWWLVFSQQHNEPRLFRRLAYPAYSLGGVFVIGGMALFFIPEARQYLEAAGFLVILGILIIVFASQRAMRVLFGTVWSFTPVMLLYAILAVAPVLDQQFTLQSVVEDLHRFDAGDAELGLWQFYFPARYYLPGQLTLLTTQEEKVAFFSADVPAFCLARERYLEDIRREVNIPIYVLATYNIQHKRFILVSQRPIQEAFLQ
jgi:4-amino-4-deoxy-L-arabinose transferase-like glycosyltransferase